jgi:pimeloyl-ACP methyl ester carboxylesterase
MIEPFRIAVPDAVLEDLRERLARTRWPSSSPYPGWEQGTVLGYLQELVAYWRDHFDWRRHEAVLNGFAQFTASVAGQRLHFIHERSPHANALPLLLMHGWPGSVYEFHKLIPMLTRPERFGGDPSDAFHVVAPSLPGYGWSPPPEQPGASPRAFARMFAALMEETLGYSRYALQGGDWGGVIASWLAFDRPGSVTGLHLNMAGLRPHGDSPPLSEEEQAFLNRSRAIWNERFAYQLIQGTRPQSLGYGLTDSPAGLAAWIVEKFRDWSDCGGEIERRFSKDELLAHVTIYWVTGAIASSMRLYYEYRHAGETLGPGERVECPTGFADFPAEMIRPPRSWLERAYRIERYRQMPRGGHFAALEEPALLAEEIRAFFRGRRA